MGAGQFFEEGNGRKSSTRLYSFIVLAFFLVFNFYYVKNVGEITIPFVSLDFVLLIAIFAPKYLHKIMEVKHGGGDFSTTKELDQRGSTHVDGLPCKCDGNCKCDNAQVRSERDTGSGADSED